MFKSVGVTDQPIILTCGSGIYATTGAFLLEKIGHQGSISMFDGSWQEYSKYNAPDFYSDDWEGKQRTENTA
jgi:3-mercaptopyruvate sulfurtransferase SseA